MFEGAQKMPLRDHFRPPLDSLATWEGFHGQWPAVIVQHLRKQLPPAYTAEPRVHSGSQVEVDIAAFEKDEFLHAQINGSGGGVATTVWAPPQPTVSVETKLAEYDEYEVRIYDARKGRHLVAAIEIVSPANKDRSEHRNIFVAKCGAPPKGGRREHHRFGNRAKIQSLCRSPDLHWPRRSNLWRVSSSVRGFLPVDDARRANDFTGLVVRIDYWSSLAHIAALVKLGASRPSGPGIELRAGLS